MASSRIFVKGLPPTFNEDEFRKHFSQNQRTITDAKIFPNRRIGYIGYKTPEDAQQAIKYFNRTFIRMSRIAVELARPVEEAKSVKPQRYAPTAKVGQQDADVGNAENKLKRKRDSEPKEQQNPKLKEFLDAMKPKGKKKGWEEEAVQTSEDFANSDAQDIAMVSQGESDGEYEQVPKKTRKQKSNTANGANIAEENSTTPSAPPAIETDEVGVDQRQDEGQDALNVTVSDADWARSRTSILLGLLDEDEEGETANDTKGIETDDSDAEHTEIKADPIAPTSIPTPPSENQDTAEMPHDADLATVRTSMRLFVRNLPYDVQRDDLDATFAPYGNIEEIHVPLDKKTGAAKGFAYIQYSEPDSAEQALVEQDGQPFQGRLIHILPAVMRRDTKLDDFALSKLPLKKQHEIKRRREAASSTFNWNALYMNADAVVSSVADRLGLSKSEVLDPTSSDAAVKQAHAETHVIQDTKSYFKQHGVDLDSFKRSQRGDTAILVKNIPFDCSRDELKRLFEEQGEVKKFLMPPSGIIAVVEFDNAAQCKAAFGTLAYRKLKSSVLFLEKAPQDLFAATLPAQSANEVPDGVSKLSTSDLKDADQTVSETAGTATLFVRNLNFTTTNQVLTDTFKPLDGFLTARVKTKTDSKKPGQILSMGFGFLEFRTATQAQTALRVMDGYTLEGHKLQIRASHKGNDAAEERKKADVEKKVAGRGTKIIIKNLPFETSKKDVRALFGAYGQLRSVRVPKKLDRAARGFAFAEFTTAKEAQNAVDALRDTHLLGRRLVLDFAAEDPEDAEAEIEKMQQKVGAQVNKVALQKLTSGGRKKFTTQNDDEDG